MNKEELVKEISKKTKLSQKISSDVLSATLEIIQRTCKIVSCLIEKIERRV